ncbi:hypothetical protein MPTK1_1g14850 [Marchantia polymorpha subsp. ruderalis]|uniref:PI-PLC Y-box domain-containing protein n=2 Tax=Marchantia polymorpha TaxID=3197 RepID=A0A176VNN2_MARPO|nr:hypothetical protein AXG93_2423s1040 [Marchantia polymorpha subsp. ruderalis]PTQ28834.1 hypothetical protein MARPO_0153s0005 [Marchantia polymorpha]BBM98615.1 hypothetical protein Mp_1g14850 [Marchantia polymorpha subsp. ruderalis]|eukprot:PTQ28834.1 hypothetical protein MARPO_0153s0005 [Marchantia polymorpha]
MVVGMGAGLQVRACCPCCCSTSPSSSASLSSPRLQCISTPGLSFRLNSSFRTQTSLISSRNFNDGSLDCSSRIRWTKGAAVPGAKKQESSRRSAQQCVLPNSSLAERSSELGEGQEESVAEDADLSSLTEWELDFCSRPILDTRGKKIWELVVCDSQRQLRFSRFYPNNVINSGTLRDALVYIIQTLGVPKPQKIRFFRSQMQTIISKACAELDIQPVPSQRCLQLVRWLEERYETVYQQHPGFQEGAGPLLLLEEPLPVDVPDTLRGEQWAFVQLPFSGVLEEMAAVERGDTFGSTLDLETLGINIPPDAMIPGVAVASSRATPLAAWTNALEIASIDVDTSRSCLILSSGVSDRWRYAFWRRSPQADQEAMAWQDAKNEVGGLHFIAVQNSLESELCSGFWLLMNVPKSPV